MKKYFRYTAIAVISLFLAIFLLGLTLAYIPAHRKRKHPGITPAEAITLRNSISEPHALFATTDGDTLFLRRWNPDSIETARKDIAVLIFHGYTAHSGAYKMAGDPISQGGFTTFGLDYRGHGLSDGNRGDALNKERWIADLAESVKYIKSLGFKRVIILGHSLGVAAAICATNAIPDDISGLILLSGAYEGKKGQSVSIGLLKKIRILAGSVFRPSFPVLDVYKDDLAGAEDQLFTFNYTLRFATMINVKQLRLPANLNVPVLVGVGDRDEMFDIEKVKEFYDMIPGEKKEFLVMQNTTHAKIPPESWEEVVKWLKRNY